MDHLLWLKPSQAVPLSLEEDVEIIRGPRRKVGGLQWFAFQWCQHRQISWARWSPDHTRGFYKGTQLEASYGYPHDYGTPEPLYNIHLQVYELYMVKITSLILHVYFAHWSTTYLLHMDEYTANWDAPKWLLVGHIKLNSCNYPNVHRFMR